MIKKLKERYKMADASMQSLRDSKKTAISAIAGIGRKNKWLRYPVLAVLVVFIFIYDLFYHMLLGFRVNQRYAKPIAIMMVLCLTITSIYIPATAFYGELAGESACENHLVHDENCGFVQAVEGHECSHEHTDECYSATVDCQHVHVEECYNEDKILICQHECSEESGCIVKELTCPHVHDEECGYVEAVEGHECTHTCEKCDGSSDRIKVGKITIEGPAEFKDSVVVDDIEISAYAPEGVIPFGASLHVEKITNESQVAEIEQLVVEDKEASTEDVVTVERSYSFDITILDLEGNEVEPDTEYGTVDVTFRNVEVADAEADCNKEVSVYHVSDDLNQVEEIPAEVSTTEDVAAISAEHFSIYTVVITTGTAKDTILHYYQGTSRANSYFTIYNEKQFITYRNLLNGYQTGDVTADDSFSTILVNGDNANPIDGITGVGQAANMKIRDLSFSVKIMDDIVVNGTWATPINVIPDGTTFDGNGHTITFNAVSGVEPNDICGVLARTVNGTVKAVTVKWGDNTKIVPADSDPDITKYASVAIRVNGEKCEIGQAITGSEALAASADGENFITLQRSDDLSIYRVELETLLNYGKTAEELENTETPEGETPETDDRVFAVYYAYEDENETISAATLSAENDYTAELNYVSVTYDLEGANTYSYKEGKLSENVMAAVRVDVKAGGSYEAKEDYEVVVKAAEGYSIPTLEKNVIIKVKGVELTIGTDYTYTYDAEKEEGTLFVRKAKITGPMEVTVKADALADVNPATKLILHTKGGSIGDVLWEKTAEYTYSMDAYKDVTLPTDITAIKGTDSIRFDGWYDNINCDGTRVTKFTYSKTRSTKHYYAKWVLNKRTDHNDNVYYEYQTDGDLEVEGYPYNGGQGMITYYQGGFQHYYNIGSLSSNQMSGSSGGTFIRMNYNVGSDIFNQIDSTNIWVAMVCTLENSLVDITYIFENRNTGDYNTGIYFGMASDVDIAMDDGATIEVGGTDTRYFTMTARENSYSSWPGQQFKLYTAGSSFGIDDVYSYWYGSYGGHSSKVFTNDNRKTGVGDSALAFSWYVNSIPAGGCVKKTTKMGSANVSEMSKVTVKLDAVEGRFANGSQTTELVSNQGSFTVNANGTVKAGSTTSTVPTRMGYKFSHWSMNAQNEDISSSVAGKTYTENRTLYANWIPEPDKSVTNASQVKKVKGSDDLVVPKQIANIVIKNTTKGADVERIEQGETVQKAAGYASGFSATLLMEGEDTKYLLPDDIVVKIVDESGKTTLLTKGTGYTYTVWDNRRKADLEIRKQYIGGDVIIEANGYELPPNSANYIQITTSATSVIYGNKGVFTASAETSKNHAADYQWYVAPYHTITLDNKEYWDYQNQDGELLTNGTYTGTMLLQDSGLADAAITISGADKPTLRISGLDVCTFDGAPNENGLHKGGYHVYCVITSTRNITAEQIVTASKTAELEVVLNRHPAPTGLEGSAPSFSGASDGSIMIEPQSSRPAMQYKLSTQSGWTNVTAEQLAAGEISGLKAGTYQFRYPADANNEASAIISVVVEDGRYITVTYKADGCDDPALATQIKHVAYGDTFSASTASKISEDGAIQTPNRAGYTFNGWSQNIVNGIADNMTITANYIPAIYKLTLNNHDADAENPGALAIFEKYSVGFFAESTCVNSINGVSKISLPTKEGYDFLGYFTDEHSGIQMICADGCLSENLIATKYMDNTTLHAQWRAKKIEIKTEEDINVEIKPTTSTDKPGTTPTDEIDPEESYEITLIKDADKEANAVYIYSNGELKKTITDVVFDSENKYTFTLVPSTVGGGTLTFKVGYVEPTKEDGSSKTDDEKNIEAEEQAKAQNYLIQYMDVDGTRFGGAFTGTFVTTKPAEGVLDVATLLPEVTKTGYNFGGWYLAARGTGTKITEIPANIIVAESESGVKYVTVYAKWNANKYNVTLVPGEDAEIASTYTVPEQYTHGALVNIALPSASEIARDNYAFKGWFETDSFDGNPVTEIDSSKVGDVTYYAKWEILPTYTVTLPTNGANGRIFAVLPLEGYNTSVYAGADYKFTVNVASAYGIRAVRANSKILTANSDGIYTVANINDDVKLTVDYNLLASTEENSNAIAVIELADGTTGYFDTVESAIDYATKHGSNSVIKLLKDMEGVDLEIPSGRAFTLDLDGHSLGSDAEILVVAGANFGIVDTAEDKAATSITIENYGIATSDIVVGEVKNYGTYTNNATVTKMTQGENESGAKSKFVNNGAISSAKIESGYFVENVLNTAPEGLTGYHTIMNGNEYYYSFQDAVDIANISESDASILMLETLDNRDAPIKIGNQNSKKITINMEGYHIYNASITTDGDVEFKNVNGNNVNPSKIDATIDNRGTLTIGDHVYVKRSVKNEADAVMTVDEDAEIDGDVVNEGKLVNEGIITGVFTNKGDAENDGTLNNVLQQRGSLDNKGTATSIEMSGGGYTPYSGAAPQVPSNPVVKTDSTPVTYYGSFKDAIDDICNNVTDGESLELKLIKDITDLGADSVLVDPQIPLVIDLNGHNLGGGTQKIVVGDGPDQGETTAPVTFKNGNTGSGEIKSPVDIKEAADVTVEEDTRVSGDVTNEGIFTNEGDIEGKFTNKGDATNNGTMQNVTQEDGTFSNGEEGTVTTLKQTGGSSDNDGTITNLNQDGGQMDNKGTITNPDVNGGGFSGNGADNANVKKEASVTENGVTKYFATLDEALEYAAEQDPAVTVKLEKDIDDETVDISGTGSPVILDLNGHNIGEHVTFKTEEGTELTITNSDTNEPKSGEIQASIINSGTFKVDEGAKITGSVDNDGEFVNDGEITGPVTNDGTFTNNGDVNNIVTQSGGSYINNGTTTKLNLDGGSFKENNNDTATVLEGGVAKIGDEIYGSLEDAIEAANESETDSEIELIDDVTLPATPAVVVENENGKKITIDLNGNSISGGTIQVGDGQNESGKTPSVDITDSAPEGSKGSIESKVEIEEDGDLGIDEGASIAGPVTNDGAVTNNGEITGDITNNGDFTNNGDVKKVDQKDGTFANGENATVEEIEQSGGKVDNEGTIDNAKIIGGEYNGNEAGETDREGAKAAIIRDGKTTYYPTLQDAIDALGDNPEAGVKIKLFDDVAEDITIDKSNVSIDLNGHSINTPGKITITEDATGVKFDDTNPGADNGVKAAIENAGELELSENTKASNVINNGTFDNNGTVETLTNEGQATNNGSIANLDQADGSFVNNGNVDGVDFDGGSYMGATPSSGLTGAVAKIGDKLYADLPSALEDANQSGTDSVIKILDDVVLPDSPAVEVGNENGKKITLDLDGHEIYGGSIDVKSPGKLTIDDNGNGLFATDITVDNGASVVIADDATVDANIENNGDVVNNGAIIGDVKNNSDGEFKNNGENSYVGGNVENAGSMINEGVVGGDVDNTGNLTNTGNLDSDVTNRGTGSFDNTGSVNGQLNNKDSATTDNNGHIHQINQSGGTMVNGTNGDIDEVLQTGGKIENNGEVGKVNTSDVNNFAGNLPENGLAGVAVVLKYADASGNDKMEYFTTFDEAIETANGKGISTEVIIVETPVNITDTLVINSNVTLVIPEDKSLVIGDNVKIVNNGSIANEGVVTAAGDGWVENNGNISNESSFVADVTNNGNIVNAGSFSGDINNSAAASLENTEAGYVTGDISNNGTVDNKGVITGDVVNAGSFANSGNGEVTKTVNNTGIIINSDNAEFTNGIKNSADGSITDTNITHQASYVDENGATRFTTLQNALTNVSANGVVNVLNDVTITEAAIVNTGITLNIVEGKKITISEGVILTNKGDINGGVIENNGTFANEGKVTGSVDNKSDMTNTGSLTGNVTNSGNLTNEGNGTITNTVENTGNVTNKDNAVLIGGVRNTGTGASTDTNSADKAKYTDADGVTHYGTLEDALENVADGGTVDVFNDVTINSDVNVKAGTKLNIADGVIVTVAASKSLTNNGEIAGGEVKNNGILDNNGSIASVVNNTADFNNRGTVTGSVTNSGNLTNEGNGTFAKTINNTGSVTNKDSAELAGGVKNTGDGTSTDSNSGHEAKYKDASGVTYYGTLEDALENVADGETVYVMNDADIRTDAVIKPGIKLNIPTDKKVTVEEGKTLTNNGEIVGGKVDNKGTLDNKGTISSDVENAADFSNSGAVTGDVTNTGKLTNSGNGSITKTVANTGVVTNKDNAELAGGVKNTDGGTATDSNLAHEAAYVDAAGITWFTSFKVAIDNVATGESVDIFKDVVINDDVVVAEGVTVNIPEGKSITVAEGKKLINNGNIYASIIYNRGSIENSDVITSKIVNYGSLINEGNGKITETVENTGSVINKDNAILVGGVKNIDEGTLVDSNVVHEAVYTDAAGVTHCGTLEEALENVADGGTVDVLNDADIKTDAVIRSGVKLNIPEGKKVTVEDGKTLTNNGEIAGGEVDNKGTFDNNGAISSDVDNAGNLNNSGTVTGNVTNSGNLNNSGNGTITKTVDNTGVVTNKDNAELAGVKNTGDGTSADSNPSHEAAYTDASGVTHYGTLENALENVADGGTVDIINDADIRKDEVIKTGIKLNIPADKKVTVEDSKKLTNNGEIAGGEVENKGILDNKGTISSDVENTADFSNSGAVTGNVTNAGSLNNSGTVTGNVTNSGDLNNSGNGTITKTVDNTGVVANKDNAEIAGVKNTAGGTSSDSNSSHEAAYIDEGGVTHYGTLEDALENTADGGTVDVLNNADIKTDAVIRSGIRLNIPTDKKVTVEEGRTLTNNGEIAGGEVDNKGSLYNKGTISSDVNNAGNLNNSGAVTGSVTNSGNLTNEGNGTITKTVNNTGVVTNKDNAEPAGGVNNTGDGTATDSNSGHEAEYTDASGVTHYGTLEEALANVADGGTVNVLNDADITTDAAVKTGVKLNIPVGKKVTVEEGKKLTNNGEIAGGQVDNKGTLDNKGTISSRVDNTDTFSNSGTVTGNVANAGSLSNSGAVTGNVFNAGSLSNSGAVTGTVTNSGNLTNSGDGSVTKTVANTGVVTNIDNAELVGGVKNTDGGKATDSNPAHEAGYVDAAGITRFTLFNVAIADVATGEAVDILKDVVINDDVVVAEGVTVNIPEGKSITVPNGKKLINNGNIYASIIYNGGTIENSNVITSKIVNYGNLINEGDGKITETVENTGNVINKDNAILDDGVKNLGMGAVKDSNPDHEAMYTDKDGVTRCGTLEEALENVADGGTVDVLNDADIMTDAVIKSGIKLNIPAGKKVTVEDGKTLTNNGEIAGGEVDNKGTFDNNGAISSDVDNAGNLNNRGAIKGTVNNDGSFINSGNGTVDKQINNTGTVINKDNATLDGGVKNDGYGTSFDENTQSEVSYVDEKGIVRYATLEDALEKVPDGGTITVINDADIDSDVVIKPGVTIEIPKDKTVTVKPGVNVTNNGEITGGEIKNSGTFNNNGTTASAVINDGKVINSGNVSGNIKNAGTLENNGNGLIEKTVDNTGSVANKDNAVINDGVKNTGNGTSTDKNPAHEAAYVDKNGVTRTTTLEEAIEKVPGNGTVEIINDTVIDESITIPSDITLNINKGAELKINDGATLINNGEINNEGAFINKGTVTGDGEGSFNNNGDYKNKGTVENTDVVNFGNGTLEEGQIVLAPAVLDGVAPKISLSAISDAAKESIQVKLTAEEEKEYTENEESIKLRLSIKDVTDSIDKKTEKQFEKNFNSDNILSFLDVRLLMQVGNIMERQAPEIDGNITVVIDLKDIPGGVNENQLFVRSYELLCYSQGDVSRVIAVYDDNTKTLTFKTNKFDVYALAYTDIPAADYKPVVPGNIGKDYDDDDNGGSGFIANIISGLTSTITGGIIANVIPMVIAGDNVSDKTGTESNVNDANTSADKSDTTAIDSGNNDNTKIDDTATEPEQADEGNDDSGNKNFYAGFCCVGSSLLILLLLAAVLLRRRKESSEK